MWDVDLQIAFVGSFLTKRYINPEAEGMCKFPET